MKKSILIIILIFIAASINIGASESLLSNIADYTINVDGEQVEMDKPSININGTTYVPLRDFAENLDMKTYWYGTDKNAKIYLVPNEFESDNWTVFCIDYGSNGIKNEYYGYKDGDGNIVIEAKYVYAEPFSEGRAVVATIDSRDGKGIINEHGEFILEEKYSSCLGYSEGICAVREAPYYINNKYYYVDRNGNEVFEGKKFLFACDFQNGFACVVTSGTMYPSPNPKSKKYSYINCTGELATDKEWDNASSFKDGYATVKNDGVRMKINTDFEVVEILED